MKRLVGCVLAAMLYLCASCALALELSVFRADGTGAGVKVFTNSDGQDYLFLPAYMDRQPLRVTFADTYRVSLDEAELNSGDVTDGLAGGTKLMVVHKGKTDKVSVMVSGNLPAVHVTTESGSLRHIHAKKGNREKGTMQIVTAQGETVFDDAVSHIKSHGNATFIYEKKPYQVKLQKKKSLLGMGEGKSYVLLANQHENSLIRNRMTFDLARDMGLRYTSEARSVDLYINGEYRGNYLLCDKVSISSGSVDITDSEDAVEFANETYLERGGEGEPYGSRKYETGTYKGVSYPKEPEDVTGGYLFEFEYRKRYPDETSGVVTQRGQPIVVKSPEEMTKAQGEYASALLNSFERAIFADDGVDHKTGRHYTEMADLESLASKFIIEEVCRNYDAHKSSQYFFKDSDSVDPKIYAGPVWDYDSAWGNFAKKGAMYLAASGGMCVSRLGSSYSWWPALYRQKDFRTEVRRQYREQMRPLLEILIGERAEKERNSVVSLETYANELDASAQMNFARWRVLNSGARAVQTGATYEENIRYLRNWIRGRIKYLDQYW